MTEIFLNSITSFLWYWYGFWNILVFKGLWISIFREFHLLHNWVFSSSWINLCSRIKNKISIYPHLKKVHISPHISSIHQYIKNVKLLLFILPDLTIYMQSWCKTLYNCASMLKSWKRPFKRSKLLRLWPHFQSEQAMASIFLSNNNC